MNHVIVVFHIFPCHVLFTLLGCLGKGQANCQSPDTWLLSVSLSLFNPGWLMVMRLIGIYKYLNYKFFSIFNVAWQDLFMGMNVWKYLQSTVMRFKIKTWVKMQIECLKLNNIPPMGLGCLFPIRNVLATKSIIYNDRFWHMSEWNIQYLEHIITQKWEF